MNDQPRKKNLINNLNDAVLDMTERIFGKEGKEFLQTAQSQLKEFSISATRAWVNFTDQVLQESKLGENQIIMKTNSTVKDLLRQIGTLEEDSEDEF